MHMKQKTVDYLHTSANKLEALFTRAVEYRAKFDKATTSVGKLMYKKKLEKTVKQMEPYMGLFSELQKLKATDQDKDTPSTQVEP